jgi:ATP-dependent Lon protease
MSEQLKTMPIVALRGMTILPGMLIHFDVNRDITIAAINEAMAGNQMVFLTNQKDPDMESPSFYDLLDIGVIAQVKQIVKLQDKVLRIMISSKERATLVSMNQTKPFMLGDVVIYEPSKEQEEADLTLIEEQAALRSMRELFGTYVTENPQVGKNVIEKVAKEKDLGRMLDLITMHLSIPMERKQDVLECFSVSARYELVTKLLGEEIQISKIQKDYRQKVKDEVEQNQKEYFLREQMKVIHDELGESDESDDIDKYKEQLDKLVCSKEVRDRISEELKRLKSIPSSSSEYVVARGYIEVLLALPWDKKSEDNDDLIHAEEILNEDHYGLDKVKERILEFLAVRKLTGKGQSPIICLVGPPGTGKTSVARSIARSLNKEYVRICLGGVRDEAEIRGHRRTYVGAMPGRLIDGLKKAKVSNPLILLDEIDKVSSDYKGDTSSALLEVLDPEQNCNFVDHYVEVPVDLSQVLFLCTANTLDTLSRPLLDRMEVIELAGYTQNEKIHIAKEHLVPKQLEKNGLKKKQLSINDLALNNIVEYYTREAGVRNLERQIGKLCRKAAKQFVDGREDQVRITKKNLEEYLGKRKYTLNLANKKPDVGIVRGLAYTTVGGDTLEIEVNTMPGEGKLELTGQLGDVMKESAQIAYSYVRSLDKMHGLEGKYFKEHDIHLHVPEGAVPKDGPSAGVTMATAIYSAISGKKVRADVAMTGEITLRGRVLPIGGLKEKLLAAQMAGIQTVFVPKENHSDVEELEKEITEPLQIEYVSNVKEILAEALLD